jgi:hypothetical protein
VRDIGKALCEGKGLKDGLSVAHLPLTMDEFTEMKKATAPKENTGSGFFEHYLKKIQQTV